MLLTDSLYKDHCHPLVAKSSISNPQQVLPLAKFSFEAHAFGNLKCRDQATL